jgi:hypothetical protein
MSLSSRARAVLMEATNSVAFPQFHGQVDRSHAVPLRLCIDDQPNQDQTPVEGSAEARCHSVTLNNRSHVTGKLAIERLERAL